MSKNIMNKMWNKIKKLLLYIKNECRDWRTVVIFIIVCAVIYSPVWLGFTLFAVFKIKWALIVATACCAFWAGPFTPFFPLCIAVTLLIKKFFKISKSKTNSDEDVL